VLAIFWTNYHALVVQIRITLRKFDESHINGKKVVGEQENSSYPGFGHLVWSTLREKCISVIVPHIF
jgi:hypothetical protein